MDIGENGSQAGVYRFLTVGKGISLEDAAKHHPEPVEGNLIRVPVELGDGARRLFRWLLNKHLSAAETERLYRKWTGEKGRAVVGSVIGAFVMNA